MDPYKVTIATWNELALLYEEKFMDMVLYNDTYDVFCGLVPTHGASILEIGCGPGNITRYLLSQRPDFKIWATDVAPNMIERAQKNNPAAECIVLDCRQIGSLNRTFDAVVCGFCLPYLSKEDAAQMICDCAALLKKDGILYFSAIEGEYSRSGYETGSSGQLKAYVYYYEEAILMEMLQQNSFELLNLSRKYYTAVHGNTSCHLIFMARKK
jgi:2-polyprenyl-3-methyl-5-hydroxy-6-metoxy-1,4-benzoquinol methylase